MKPEDTAKPKKQPFSDKQIRDKAYEMRQKNQGRSIQDYRSDAIKELKRERLLQPFRWISQTYFWQWTGFGEKKLWDILQLLIVPIVLAIAGFSLQEFGKQKDQMAATDKANQETLVKYLDQMEPLLQKGLLKTNEQSETFIIAQAKTLIALQSLDPKRQHLVIQYLNAAKLDVINKGKGILYQAQMTNVNLTKAGFSNAKLKHANFSGADLSGADLKGADLSGADLKGADLSGADLSGADLSGADLKVTNLGYAILRNANLSNAKLRGANITYTKLNNANLSKADLSVSNLSNASLIGANLNKADLLGSILKDTDLSSADLSSADLSSADLSSANLSSANLTHAVLINVDLKETTLSNSNLINVDLTKAKNFSPQQIKLAMNWKTALYDQEVSRNLGSIITEKNFQKLHNARNPSKSSSNATNIEGTWKNSIGVVYRVVQNNNSFNLVGNGHISGVWTDAKGTIINRNFTGTFTTSLPSSGDIKGTISEDGSQITGIINDSRQGHYTMIFTKQ